MCNNYGFRKNSNFVSKTNMMICNNIVFCITFVTLKHFFLLFSVFRMEVQVTVVKRDPSREFL